jgi:cyclase
VGIDSRATDDEYDVYQNTGDPTRTSAASRKTLDWIREAQARGAGEIVLNCMNQDGVREGYDCIQLQRARALCNIPLVASGGAGSMQDFATVFSTANVDGALAASVFHDKEFSISELKSWLTGVGVHLRKMKQ